MSKKIDFSEQYTFNELSNALSGEQLPINEWVTIFNRLYPRSEGQTSTSNISFFAQEINRYRSSRVMTERVAKAGATVVMINGLIWCTQLAATTIIGSASLTIYMLNAAITFFSPIIFNPKIGFPEGVVRLTAEQEKDWLTYRKRWLKQVESNQLTDSNNSKQAMTRNIAITLVVSFAAGLTLATQALSTVLMAHLITYVAGLVLSPDNSAFTEGYSGAPETEFDYELATEVTL